ncbi:unnamed protein product [Cyprideis torosa]|uniref:Haloacid dehalogenase-like hydrolase domain-containing 5 n=1 Tax=Cyprideis torosa TaxID=163714 RepID=A0A7R8WI55_9CRUS|nr:unnamed protein product [Cyprideis torosa]CAG0898345.1 unnamed protein product [Cyprideis torosa]
MMYHPVRCFGLRKISSQIWIFRRACSSSVSGDQRKRETIKEKNQSDDDETNQEHSRNNCSSVLRNKKVPNFGLLFDIDGVLVRGRNVFPFTPPAFAKLVDEEGKFRVPTVFVTNAGNRLRHEKAEQLSEWLAVKVSEDQVIMSHSPLRMFKSFHDKRVLVAGQGPIREIASSVGFTNIITIDDFREAFPELDAVDMQRRQVDSPCSFEQYFPPIEAIVLLGEPVRWETALQLIVDALMCNGKPTPPFPPFPKEHLPILACNMDLLWMAEAPLPRFGHGAFLVCLENLYKKVTGADLSYTALVGKPSEITYHHAERIILEQARKITPAPTVKRLYAIGDNVNTDIFGANLYNRYLLRQKGTHRRSLLETLRGSKSRPFHGSDDQEDLPFTAEECLSILVQTGVFGDHCVDSATHSPRDFLPVEGSLREPDFIAEDVYKAIDLIFEKEDFT